MIAYRSRFARDGASKGLLFNVGDLPVRDSWDSFFPRAMGSPDIHGRQLNGMGGGLTSLSNVWDRRAALPFLRRRRLYVRSILRTLGRRRLLGGLWKRGIVDRSICSGRGPVLSQKWAGHGGSP
jgi:hypothetical protein